MLDALDFTKRYDISRRQASPDRIRTLRGSRRISSVRSAWSFENYMAQLERRLPDAIVSINSA